MRSLFNARFLLLSVLLSSFLLAFGQVPTWQWAKRCGSTSDNIPSISGDETFNDIKIDKNGNIYAVGNFFGSTVFHNAQLFGAATPFQFAKDDAYLIKYSSCGQLLWWRRMGGTNNDGATSLVLDNQGKVIVTGYCTSNPSYYSGGANSTTISGAQANGSQFIAKFDTAGNFLSVNTYSLLLMKLLLNSQGDIFATDGFFAAKINALGVVTSTLAFFPGNTPFYPAIVGIALDKNDNIYLSGFFNNTISIGSGTILLPTSSTLIPSVFADNSLVMKCNPVGTCQWYSRGFSSVSDGATGCVIDTSGSKLVVSGRAWNNSSVFGYTVNGGMGTTGNPIFFLQASNGNLINAITGSVFNQGGIFPLTKDHDNSIYFAGRTNSLIAFNSNTYTSNSSGIWQSCIGKFDSGNNFLWINMLPQSGSNSSKERVFSIDVSQQGNIHIGGMFAGTLDSLGTSVNPIGGEDGFVAKFGFPCGSTLTTLSPLAPTSLSAAYQGTLSNLVNWVDNSNYENGFELWYHDASPTFSLLATLPANTTTYNHSGLSYTTTYCYKVRAFNTIGPSVYTNSDCATTPAPAAPQAPTSLTAVNPGSLLNNVAWVDNSSNETSFELWYHGSNPTFSLLATLPANTTTYTHSGLNPGTNYCYKALATNSIGSSAFTNTDCAMTPAVPNSPTNLTALNIGTLVNNVNWVDNSSDESNFELWYHDANPTFSLLVTLPANTTTYTHTGLSHTTTYCYKALATNSLGLSAFTNTDCATTPDTSTVGLKEVSFAKNFNLYPNPTKGTVYLEFYGNGEVLSLKITDPLGRVIREEEISTSAGENEVKVVLPSTKGLYFVQLRDNTSSLNTKVLVE